jgi:hypothetical protein
LDAMSRASEYAPAWWEEVGQTGMFMGHRFNDRAWSLQVRNRFPTEHKENKELGVGGARVAPVGTPARSHASRVTPNLGLSLSMAPVIRTLSPSLA